MRVLVTGASGQLGKAIAALLARDGCQLIGTSRKPAAVPGVSDYVAADIGGPDFMERLAATASCEAIVHTAASRSYAVDDPSISLTNCVGTHQVLKLAALWKSRYVVYLSGTTVIGRPRHHPVTEEHPVQPLTAYLASKLYGEYLMTLPDPSQCRTVTLRLTSPAGPGTPTTRILGMFVRRSLDGLPLQILGRGTRRQNYVDVRDAAAVVGACLRTRATGLYHIAAAESISNSDLAQICVRELGSPSGIEYVGRPDPEEGVDWDISIAKARQELSYNPQYTIRDSIRALADEYSGHQ